MGLNDNVKLKTLLISQQFKIPQFQRNYSWKKDQLVEFWDDACEAIDEHNTNYFFGPMVLIKNNDLSYFKVVDGQQRLTTVTILISIMKDIFEEIGDTYHYGKMENYLYPVTGDGTDPTLELNENNDAFYRNCILSKMTPDEKLEKFKSTKVNEQNIFNSYKLLHQKIKAKFNFSTAEDGQELFDFIDKILDSFRIYEIIVESEEQAFKLFATLNQRGLDLSISDLIKNHIFSKSESSHRDRNHKTWKDIVDTLADNKNMDVFLRHHWIAHHEKVTQQKLFTEITKYVNNNDDVRKYLDSLLKSCKIYSELIGDNKNPIISDNFSDLFESLKNDSAQPLFLMAFTHWGIDSKDIEELSKICLDVHFRGKTIGNRAASEMVNTFAKAAKEIRKEKANLSKVKNILKEIDISDSEFKSTIKDGEIKSNIAKYLLKNIEINRETLHPVKKVDPRVTLEHVLPQTMTDSWSKIFDEPTQRKYLNRIGNLTLLHGIPNSELQNKSFDEKKSIYAKQNDLTITKEISAYEKWGIEEIENRCSDFSDDAATIWKTILDESNDDNLENPTE
jgi:uncharacterized protein with ParB-like and HNH nuclease domain